MRKYYIYFLLLVLSFYPIYAATNNKENKSIRCISSEIKKENDSLYIHLKFDTSNHLSSNESIEIIPWLGDTNQAVILPSLIICGKNQYKLKRRAYAFLSQQERYTSFPDTSEIRLDTPSTNIESYTTVIAFMPWMDQASLDISYQGCHCGRKNEDSNGTIQSLGRLVEKENGEETSSVPHIPADKADVSSKNSSADTIQQTFCANIMYPQSANILEPDFADNEQVWSEIACLAKRNHRKEIVINSIRLDAYASPEGRYLFNEELSEKRAKNLEKELITLMQLPEEIIKTYSHGEDWEGLAGLITQSDATYKSSALNIIRNIGIFKGREKDLMLLNHGSPYLEMLEKLFPFLRKINVKIDYTITN